MTTKSQGRLMRRVLFLEIGGFLSLGVTMAIVAMLLSINLIDGKALLIPVAGMFLVFVFILFTIRYTRRDLHRIHELHSRPIFGVGRNMVYLLSIGLLGYAIYLVATSRDFWSDIGLVILVDLLIIIAIFAFYYTYVLGYLIQHEHYRHKRVSFFDLFLVIILPIALVGVSAYKLLETDAETVVSGDADFNIPAKNIIAEFEKNDSAANAKYHGRILQFGGVVTEIGGDSAMLLKLNVGVDETTANCGFDKSENAGVKKVKQGDSIVVKCSCSSYTKPEDEMSMLSEKSLDLVRCKLLETKASK